jgi:hypothetical protein
MIYIIFIYRILTNIIIKIKIKIKIKIIKIKIIKIKIIKILKSSNNPSVCLYKSNLSNGGSTFAYFFSSGLACRHLLREQTRLPFQQVLDGGYVVLD